MTNFRTVARVLIAGSEEARSRRWITAQGRRRAVGRVSTFFSRAGA